MEDELKVLMGLAENHRVILEEEKAYTNILEMVELVKRGFRDRKVIESSLMVIEAQMRARRNYLWKLPIKTNGRRSERGKEELIDFQKAYDSVLDAWIYFRDYSQLDKSG